MEVARALAITPISFPSKRKGNNFSGAGISQKILKDAGAGGVFVSKRISLAVSTGAL